MIQAMKVAENHIDEYYETLLAGGSIQIGKYLVIPIELKTDEEFGVIVDTEAMTEDYYECIRYIEKDLAKSKN